MPASALLSVPKNLSALWNSEVSIFGNIVLTKPYSALLVTSYCALLSFPERTFFFVSTGKMSLSIAYSIGELDRTLGQAKSVRARCPLDIP